MALHTIRRQYLHVELNGTESDAIALQRRLTGLCRDWLMPAVERAIERCSPTDEIIYIERLELDLGDFTIEGLKHDLVEVVERRLAELLTTLAPPGESSPPGIPGKVERKTSSHAIHDALMHFLKTGSLPWSFRMPEGSTLEQLARASWHLAPEPAIAPEKLIAVRQALAQAPVRRRLARQFSAAFLEDLLSVLSLPGKQEIEEALRVVHGAGAPQGEVRIFEQYLWETVLAAAASRKSETAMSIAAKALCAMPESSEIRARLTRALEIHWPCAASTAGSSSVITTEPAQEDIPKTDAPPPLHHLTSKPGATAPSRPATLDGSEKAGSITGKRPETSESAFAEPGLSGLLKPEKTSIEASKHIGMKGSVRSKSPLASPLIFEESQALIREHPEAVEGLYVDNAGLVILHPFLPQFFRALDIASEDSLLRPDRALCLLHFLSSGRTAAPEYELVFPKVLCGIPLPASVDTSLELASVEMAEANALLEAVARHWEALRDTSSDELRGAFLLRPGKVSLRDDGDWLLQVEHKTWDILLEQLPWGISTVKLPWMERILWVEWR